MHGTIIIIIIVIFLRGLGRLTCSGIDALPSFPGASTISSSSRFVVEGVFRESGVVHSFKMVDPVGSEADRLLVLWVRIPPVAWMSVSCECCVLSEVSGSGRSLIQRSPTECTMSECDREASTMWILAH